MLHLYTSNRLENLANHLCEQVMQPLSGAASALFQSDQIVVQNPGMQHWLSMELASRHGIAMNIKFPLLGRALWERVREVLGEMPEQDLFRREVLVWRIYEQLPLLPCFASAKQSVTNYMIGYYSALRPHKHNGGLPPNVAEQAYWKTQKTVA